MQLIIMMVGKTRRDFIQAGMDFYYKRLSGYYRVSLITVREEKPAPGLSAAQIMAREGARLLARRPQPGRFIALDAGGQEFSSAGLSDWLTTLEQEASTPLAFIIGGHLGLSPEVLEICPRRLALSRLTFTHELSRLLLLEQLYRAATIRAGHPYHN